MPTIDKTILILGGTSDIGRAVARVYAEHGWSVLLAGRDEAALARECADIATRTGAKAASFRFDALDAASFAAFADALPVLPDAVVSVVGLLGDQSAAQTDLDHAATIMRSNYEGPALILGLFAERFCRRGSGAIIGVSSVAGDRGRASNYVYGSAKAGFSAFLSGLRNRCCKQGVRVLTVKPGFVRTRMTRDMALPALLTASPDAIGRLIFNSAGADVVYSSLAWRAIMLIIAAIPEAIFKRLSL